MKGAIEEMEMVMVFLNQYSRQAHVYDDHFPSSNRTIIESTSYQWTWLS